MTRTERSIIAAYTRGDYVLHIMERFSIHPKRFYELLKESGTQLRHGRPRLEKRNIAIARERRAGAKNIDLAVKYGLSERSISLIVNSYGPSLHRHTGA